jgi:hypothetical protein
MAGNTLTDDFWANDILWQLSSIGIQHISNDAPKEKQF